MCLIKFNWASVLHIPIVHAPDVSKHFPLSCSPNFPRALYLDERTLTYEPIVNFNIASKFV